MTQLIYPPLLCFTYHIQASVPHESWAQWQAAHAQFQNQSSGSELEYVGQDWDASYEHQTLGDTAALLLITAAKDETTPQPIELLTRLKAKLNPLQGNIGKTWLVIAQQPQGSDANSIVNAIQTLWATSQPRNAQSGSFVGNDLRLFQLNENQQLVILLAPDSQERRHIPDFYYDFQRLFYYHHKIIWQRNQGQIIKTKLINAGFFPLPDETIPASLALPHQFNETQALNTDLKQFRSLLYQNMVKLDRHTCGLEGLALQLESLKINLDNYQIRLNWIQSLSEKDQYSQPSDLKPWLDWLNDTASSYPQQIQQDIASLRPGLKVREQRIKTMDAFVNVAQGERDRAIEARDRNIEALVGSAGVGIGAASAAAGAWAGETARPLHTFGLSLGIGVLCGVVVYGVVRLIRR